MVIFASASSATAQLNSVSSNPVALILWSEGFRWFTCSAGGSGEFRQVCINALPLSLVIMGCSFLVANVYTWPVSLATSSITCVPVRVDNSYAWKRNVTILKLPFLSKNLNFTAFLSKNLNFTVHTQWSITRGKCFFENAFWSKPLTLTLLDLTKSYKNYLQNTQHVVLRNRPTLSIGTERLACLNSPHDVQLGTLA